MSWRFIRPSGSFTSYATLAVPFRARAGARSSYSEAPIAVRARITVRAGGEKWIRNAPSTDDTSGRYETWSCTVTDTIRETMPVEVVARGGRRFDLTALPATGFTAPTDAGACTESHPDALPDEGRVAFGDAELRRALTIVHRLTSRDLRSRRRTLRLRQPAGPATAIDCRSEFAPVCTQTATASGTVHLTKQCRDGEGSVDGSRLNCDATYPEPRRRPS